MNKEIQPDSQNVISSQLWNHYVVIEGEPPQKLRSVLLLWLLQHCAVPLSDSDQIYFYLSRIGVDIKEKLSEEIREFRREYKNDENQQPYRIFFLGPDGRHEIIH